MKMKLGASKTSASMELAKHPVAPLTPNAQLGQVAEAESARDSGVTTNGHFVPLDLTAKDNGALQVEKRLKATSLLKLLKAISPPKPLTIHRTSLLRLKIATLRKAPGTSPVKLTKPSLSQISLSVKVKAAKYHSSD